MMKSGLNSQELIKSGGVSVAVSNKISVEDLWKKYKDDNVLMGDVMAERYCFYFVPPNILAFIFIFPFIFLLFW